MNPFVSYFSSDVDYNDASAERTGGSNPGRIGDEPPQKPDAVGKAGQRVCDRCIIKKVKCDMKQPSCARCLEVDATCVYSVRKRKPGPVKGSKHSKRKISKEIYTSSTSNLPGPPSRPETDVQQWQLDQTDQQPLVSTTSDSATGHDGHVSDIYNPDIVAPTIPHSIPSPLGIAPGLDQQRPLLESFFLHIHPSIPLFYRHRLMSRFESGLIPENLMLTICVVTAKILGLGIKWNGSNLENCTAYLMDLKVLENEGAGKSLSLDNFRQGCLLAFYAFHQYPGEQSWMRIGNLTRKAYQCGLHQIDYHPAGSQFDRDKISDEELEEWRYVWWCIYCLDSYSNITAVTPFVIEAETVKTALVSNSLSKPAIVSPPVLKYLPDETDVMWRLAKEVTSSSGEINFNMHILTTAMIKEAATIVRLRKQSTSTRIISRLANFEDHVSAFRLALPVRYLNASRNAFVDESPAEHHARLICVLHTQLMRMLTYFPFDPEVNESDWLMRWQRCLEGAEDMVSIVKQWDGQYFSATDPAICCVISTCVVLLHLHKCAVGATVEFKVRMDTQKSVLMLFLQQFASSWSLPRFLIISCEQFEKIVKGPLTAVEADRLLTVASGPLNYRWLNFLSLKQDFENLDTPHRMYESLFTQEWNANEWESLW